MTHGLTIEEVAKTLGVSARTIHRYIRKGLLEANKVGTKLYISEDSLRHFDKLSDDIVDSNLSQIDIVKHVVIERQEYQGLLTRLSQLETERLYLIEHKQTSEAKEEQLREQDKNLALMEHQLKEAEEKIKALETNIDRLKKPWWKRLWGKE